MNALLLDVAPIVTILNAECPTLAGRCFEAIPADDWAVDMLYSPMAFVYINDEIQATETRVDLVKQQIESTITVDIFIRRSYSKNDRYGRNDSRLLKNCRLEINNALMAKPLENVVTLVSKGSAGLIKSTRDYIHFRDGFNARHIIRRRQ